MRINFWFIFLFIRSSLYDRDASVHQIWWKYPIGKYWHFSKFSMAAAVISDFYDKWMVARSAMMAVCFLSRAPNFIAHICSRLSTDDVNRTNFRFRIWRTVVLRLCTKFGLNIFIHYTQILAFCEIQYGRLPPSWIWYGKLWDHPRRPIRGGYLLQKFRHDRRSSVQVIWICCSSRLKSIYQQKIVLPGGENRVILLSLDSSPCSVWQTDGQTQSA